MGEAEVIAIVRESLWTALAIATPILAVALTVGLVIGLLQALTSIQELTLTFVPKLIAIGVVFWMTMSYMGQGLLALFHDRILPLVAGG